MDGRTIELILEVNVTVSVLRSPKVTLPLNTTLLLNVETPDTINWSVISTVPPKESRIRLPVEVSISLSPEIPIWILSIDAPALASSNPSKVPTPITLRFLVVANPETPSVAMVAIPVTFKSFVDTIPVKKPFLAKSSS